MTTAPAGMDIDETTGVISWTPTSTGEYNVSVVAKNATGSSVQHFTIMVGALPVVTSTAVTEAGINSAYAYNIDATGYPTPIYILESAPLGMTINETTGEISWTPDMIGDYDVTVQIENLVGFTLHSFQITVSYRVFLPIIVR
ncbi:MAG: hypothetical protein GY806_08420 [Gammaproteobacteria bacterium]|nr:hypothetical protein [Gammaproteobacteria bacterium]